jgi:hypothetical protein
MNFILYTELCQSEDETIAGYSKQKQSERNYAII